MRKRNSENLSNLKTCELLPVMPVLYIHLPNGRIKVMDGMARITAAIKEAKKKRPVTKHHKPSN